MPKNYPANDGTGAVARGSNGRAAGGGEYSNPRGSQGAPGGGEYSWSKAEGGHSPGGGDYSWSKAESGQDPQGDVSMPGMADRSGGLQVDPGESMTTRPDPYNPYQNGMI
jgi:hypothetical protein